MDHPYCSAEGCFVQIYCAQCSLCGKFLCSEHLPVEGHVCKGANNNSTTGTHNANGASSAAASNALLPGSNPAHDHSARSSYRRTRSREVSLGLPGVDRPLSLGAGDLGMPMDLPTPELMKMPSASDLLRRGSSMNMHSLSREPSGPGGIGLGDRTSLGPGYANRGLSIFGHTDLPEYLRQASPSGLGMPNLPNRQVSLDGHSSGVPSPSPTGQSGGAKFTRAKSRELNALASLSAAEEANSHIPRHTRQSSLLASPEAPGGVEGVLQHHSPPHQLNSSHVLANVRNQFARSGSADGSIPAGHMNSVNQQLDQQIAGAKRKLPRQSSRGDPNNSITVSLDPTLAQPSIGLGGNQMIKSEPVTAGSESGRPNRGNSTNTSTGGRRDPSPEAEDEDGETEEQVPVAPPAAKKRRTGSTATQQSSASSSRGSSNATTTGATLLLQQQHSSSSPLLPLSHPKMLSNSASHAAGSSLLTHAGGVSGVSGGGGNGGRSASTVAASARGRQQSHPTLQPTTSAPQFDPHHLSPQAAMRSLSGGSHGHAAGSHSPHHSNYASMPGVFDGECARMERVLNFLMDSSIANNSATKPAASAISELGGSTDISDVTDARIDELVSSWQHSVEAYDRPEGDWQWALANLSLGAGERLMHDSAVSMQGGVAGSPQSSSASASNSRAHSPSAYGARGNTYSNPSVHSIPPQHHPSLPSAARLIDVLFSRALLCNELECAAISIYLDRLEPDWLHIGADRGGVAAGLIVKVLHYIAYMVKSAFNAAPIPHTFLPYLTGAYPDFSQAFSIWLHERPAMPLALPPIVLNHRLNIIKKFKR